MVSSRLRTSTLALQTGLALTLFGLPLRSEEPFDYFANSWSVIGLKDYTDGTRLTPTNELLLSGGRRLQIRYGRQLTLLGREHTKTLLDGWLPVVLLTAHEGAVRYDFTLWATPLPTVKDWRKAFDWPTETENSLNWVRVKATNTGKTRAEAKMHVAEAGAVGFPPAYVWNLRPGQGEQGAVYVPFHPTERPPSIRLENAGTWLDRAVAYWRGLLAQTARIEVPCRKATEALRAAHVCQLIANDHGVLHGGEGFYDEFYIRDGGYQLMELEEAGLWDAAGKAVEHYLRCQRPDGRFESQANQFDANGQALWVLWQYWKITGDHEWLAKAYPQMLKAAEWVKQARRQAAADSPFAGLLPNAPADGEYLWDGKHHIVGYDFWNLRGLLCTAEAARALGRTDEAAELAAEAADYRSAIDAAWKKAGVPHFPPSWEKDGTHWGNTETLWPTELFQRYDRRVSALLSEVRERHGGGFLEGTIRWTGTPGAIHPYMSAYSTMASLVRGEHERVVEEFYWYLLHSTATHAFPEGILYKRRFAWSDTIPHVTGASNYALMLRHMLIHERGDELHLLLAVPDWWLGEGQVIRIDRAPTHFGELSLTVRGTARGVQVTLEPPSRQPPKRIVLHLPKSRPLVGALPGVDVLARPDQAKRWDFATVVKLYRQQAPVEKPIPGLVKLPLAAELRAKDCSLLDLAPLANTDPFTAPFGVPNPGKYLFTGMPVGDQTVGGVPFRILDPAANGGRGLVVLHSPKGPTNIDWPKAIEVAVNQAGKRVFFLGNVHGWGSSDEGTGEWGAVAEYVIHYADGTTQSVPIITGRTAEDWTYPPEVTGVFCGLQGDPWHLNVLGVTLRPVKVDKIVFRDLDTIAAPVLVAVTVER
jgi:hypothetical protein